MNVNDTYKGYDNERVILGCLVLFPELYGEKIQMLSADLFADNSHRDIFCAILAANNESRGKYDAALVTAHLTDKDCKSELVHCAEVAFKTSPFDEHFKLLMNAAQERFIREQLTEKLINGTPTPAELNEISKIAADAYTVDKERKPREVFNRYVESLAKPADVLYTKYKRLDELTGGLRRGTLTIIGARPSVGKTTLSLNIAENIAGYGRKVAFFTLEMTADMIIEKLAARGCNTDYTALRYPDSDTRGRVRYYFDNSVIPDNLTIIDDTPMIENICGYILGAKPDVAVIDYVQIVQTLQRFDNVRIKIDYIAAQLKQAAKRSGCRVILLSQLRRDSGDVKKPTMSDLKESSGLEQDGDYIVLLFRPHAQDKTYEKGENRYLYPPNEAALLLEKNKFGRTGEILMNFDGAHQSFTEVWKER